MASKSTTRKATKTTTPQKPAAAIAPVISVPDVPKAVEFYGRLGFETLMTVPGPGGETNYAILQYRDTQLHVGGLAGTGPDTKRMKAIQKGPRGLGVNFYTDVEDVAAVHRLCQKAGVTVLQPPKDEFWGDRVLTILDPFGFEWSFAEHVRDVSPEEMAQAAAAANN
jgi:PhnB protein